ncbi:hypothetical protein IT087_02575 [Candidatus Uhrbacteria bacterium]|nr:hypothetical protein [Candidatus Uhrbacteria bacterium]
MAKKQTKRKPTMKLPTESVIMALGAAAILRDKTYDALSMALEQTKWVGKSQKEIQKKLMSSGEREYARLMRDAERTLDRAMKQAKKPIKRKR